MHCNKERNKNRHYEKDTTHYIYLTIAMTHQAQNKQIMNNGPYPVFGNSWRKWRKSLPKSASSVDTILKQAVGDNNSPQMIKSSIHQGKYDLAIDTENDTICFTT